MASKASRQATAEKSARWLYLDWLLFMAQLKKVKSGNGDEESLEKIIHRLASGGDPERGTYAPIDPMVLAGLTASAGAAAADSARKCKECATHATRIAQTTLRDFGDRG